jgi:hypothetical protein
VQCNVKYRSTDSFSCASPSRFIFSYVELCPFRYNEKPALSGLSSTRLTLEFLIHLSLGCILTVLYTIPPHVMSHSGRQSIIFSLFVYIGFRFLNNFFWGPTL